MDAAYGWVCQRRAAWSPHADIWWLRRDWRDEKQALKAALLSGRYRFGLLDRVTKADGTETDLWSARAALVLKALTIVLAPVLPVSPRCTHVKGNGGAKAAVRQVSAALPANKFVFRTDVKSCYASIDHHLLLDRLALWVDDRFILNLLYQYMNRTAERGGSFWECDKGISLGCPLSPLIGAFFLDELDRRLSATGLFYVRFMDDILVLAPTRWKLRRAVGLVNAVLGSLRLEKHPDKTSIGRIERGFDFLGYHFTAVCLSLAPGTLASFADKASRLYEQERERSESLSRVGVYVRRWLAWARGGLAMVVPGLLTPLSGVLWEFRPLDVRAPAAG
ncbi:MAG: reverse transcriptase, partial [Acetobacteraceae bacterium]|nr:reverse transcriptase [Acetobacteraceae bacterium]